MPSSRPVYISGSGIVCAAGLCKEEVLQTLLSCRSGIAPVRYLQTQHSEFPVGEVKLTDAQMRERLGIPEGEASVRTSLEGMLALGEALKEAGLRREDLRQAGFISGTTVGGMDQTERRYLDFLENDRENAYLRTHDCGSGSELIADRYGDFAFINTISTACSSAANAIGLAAEMIRLGEAEIVVSGGAECLTRFHLNGFNSLMILDRRPCRPFDAERAGLNLGEGAAYIVLESEESLKKRGARPLARLSGYGNACDAFHQTASSPDGEGAYLAMCKALDDAGLRPVDIDYINAHGTGTPNNDLSESTAMLRVFGENLPPMSSTKSVTGHTTSASGAIESVICLLALREGFLPVNCGWSNPMPENNVRPNMEISRGTVLRHILCNSFGFGGNDSSLIISAL